MSNTMLIDIDRLPKEGLRLSREFEFLSADLVEENAVFLEPVRADLTVRKTGEEVLVQGRLTTRLSFVCGRCLTPFEFPVDSRFDLVYLPDELDSMKDGLSEADLERTYFHDRQLDLRAVILEQLNLTFPPKPLCSEACEGICAVCGEIVRDAKCSCAVRETDDPRWARLKSVTKDKS